MKSSSDANIPFLGRSEHDCESADELETTHLGIRKGRKWWLGYVAILLFVSNSVTFAFSKWSWQRNLDSLCNTHTSMTWTPLLEDVKITYTTTFFNGSFTRENVYRQAPSLEVDEAWDALGANYNPALIRPEEAEKAGIPSDRMMVGEELGGPGYPADVEGIHQIHCLNLLRQSLYFNSDYYHNLGTGAFVNNEEVLKLHIGHCLDMIRQQLMCTADIGFVPYLWAGSPPHGPHVFPDFNRNHKCKNFEDIRAWAEKRQGSWGHDLDIKPRPGALVLAEIP